MPPKVKRAPPDQMVDHDQFLRALLEAFPKQVFLVGRYADDALRLPADGILRVFLPDFHWMSRACLKHYAGGYAFNGNAPTNRPLFATLLALLETIRDSGAGLELIQLGDRFDLWREKTNTDSDILETFDRVRNDAPISGLASRLENLGTQFIRGNHDAWLGEIEAQRPAMPKSLREIVTAAGRILIVHGHQFDTVEGVLTTSLKADLVGLAPNVRPGTYDIGPFPNDTIEHIHSYLELRNRANRTDLYPDVAPAGARLLNAITDIEAIANDSTTYLDVSVFSHGTGNRNDFEHISYLTFADQTLLFEQNDKNNHAVHVIGHTHHARILVDRLPKGAPHVTLDCGGWIENCTVTATAGGHASVTPSAQLGVQAGNDVRIYQLAPAPDGGR